MTTRRNALALLGIVPASAAFGAEDFDQHPLVDDKKQVKPEIDYGLGFDCKKAAASFRALADLLEDDKSGVNPVSIKVTSEAKPNAWTENLLEFRFEIAGR